MIKRSRINLTINTRFSASTSSSPMSQQQIVDLVMKKSQFLESQSQQVNENQSQSQNQQQSQQQQPQSATSAISLDSSTLIRDPTEKRIVKYLVKLGCSITDPKQRQEIYFQENMCNTFNKLSEKKLSKQEDNSNDNLFKFFNFNQ